MACVPVAMESCRKPAVLEKTSTSYGASAAAPGPASIGPAAAPEPVVVGPALAPAGVAGVVQARAARTAVPPPAIDRRSLRMVCSPFGCWKGPLSIQKAFERGPSLH